MAFSDCIDSLENLKIELHEMFPIQPSCFCFLAKTKVFACAVIDQLTTVTGKLEKCLGGLPEFNQLRTDLSKYNYCPGELDAILGKRDQLLENIKGIMDGIGEDSLATGDQESILDRVQTLIDDTNELVNLLDANDALLNEKNETAKALEKFKFDSSKLQLLKEFPIDISRDVMADLSLGAIRLLHRAKRILIKGAGHGEESELKSISIRLFEKIESIDSNFISKYILLKYLKVNAESCPDTDTEYFLLEYLKVNAESCPVTDTEYFQRKVSEYKEKAVEELCERGLRITIGDGKSKEPDFVDIHGGIIFFLSQEDKTQMGFSFQNYADIKGYLAQKSPEKEYLYPGNMGLYAKTSRLFRNYEDFKKLIMGGRAIPSLGDDGFSWFIRVQDH